MHVTVLSFHSRVFKTSTGTLSWPSPCSVCPFPCSGKRKKKKGKAIPVQAWAASEKVPGGRGSQISRPSAYEGGKVFSPTHRPRLPSQEIFLALISVRGWVDSRATVRPEGLCPWKIAVTPSEFDPATSRLVAQCLNQLRHRVHLQRSVSFGSMTSHLVPVSLSKP